MTDQIYKKIICYVFYKEIIFELSNKYKLYIKCNLVLNRCCVILLLLLFLPIVELKMEK